MREKAQVVIVGAGPTGLMSANLLGQLGVETLVLERHTSLSSEARAVTIDDEGLRICQVAGLAEEVCSHTRLDIHADYVADKQFLARVAPRYQPNGYPLISTFYQPEFEMILLRGAERFPHVSVSFGHTLEAIEQAAHGASLTVRGPDGSRQHVGAAYVLACDGGKSGIRQALDIPLRPPRLRDLFSAPSANNDRMAKRPERGPTTTQRWLVVDYHDEYRQSERIIFYCNPARPAVSVQAPGKRRRWEFMLKPDERDEDLLSNSIIQMLIEQAEATLPPALVSSPPQPPASYNNADPANTLAIDRKLVYQFYTLIATHFSRGRVFLLGDAAHLMPPFGGQGMNSGLRDAHNLCWKLKLVLDGWASAPLLDSYQQERYCHVAQMITFSSLLGRLIMPTNPMLARSRNIALRLMNRVSFVRTQLSEMRVRPQPRYTHGFLLTIPRSKLTGRLLPQPYVLYQGRRIRLDEALGSDFVLLRLFTEPEKAFVHIEDQWPKVLKLRYICVLPGQVDGGEAANARARAHRAGEALNWSTVVEDCDGVLSRFLEQRRDIFVLVRPDGYIMAVFHVQQVDAARQALYRLLGIAYQPVSGQAGPGRVPGPAQL